MRSDQVVISWPAATGTVRIAVYAFTGERLLEATVPPSPNEYVWNLTVGAGARRVVNGAYVILVDAGGRRYRRRLFVARPPP